MAWIGASNIISPLGTTTSENFQNILDGKTGIQLHNNLGLKGERLPAALVGGFEKFDPLEVASQSIQSAIDDMMFEDYDGFKKCLIISTTKGDLNKLKGNPSEASLSKFKEEISKRFPQFDDVQLVSNACISGVLSLIWANDLIESEEYGLVAVCGVDMLSRFTLAGFQSFFALSDDVCKPFDKDRVGINLGEAASTIMLSSVKDVFQTDSFWCHGGTSNSDANHISGPSRTGEGLYRSVKRTLERSRKDISQIDFISAHGTGTNYNDEMEAIAFDRLGLNDVPLNSLKGYFGHTFGAAGLVETSICLESLWTNKLVASRGYDECGTSKELNVLKNNLDTDVKTILKTASGFGGSNASILISR